MTTVGKSLTASFVLHSVIVLAAVALTIRERGIPRDGEHADDPDGLPLMGEFSTAITVAASAEEQAPTMPPEPANAPQPPLPPTPGLAFAEIPTLAPHANVATAVPSLARTDTPPAAIARQKSRKSSPPATALHRTDAGELGGGNIPSTPARYARCPAPLFPDEARKAGLAGTVLLRVEIDENGRPLAVAVRRSSGHEVLDQAALRAVRNWRFEPARSRGKTIGTRLEIPIRFATS